jgi:flavin reductase (DIM6/NTAB) family NADH-FMN oxidoreductase RutF
MQNNGLSIPNQSLVFNQEGVRHSSAATRRATYSRPGFHSPSTAIDQTIVIEPPILYFGTPVVLTGTTNEDGSPNLAPISCVWWLGWSCVLGLDVSSNTTQNLERDRQCVLNLPSAQLVGAVDFSGKCVICGRAPGSSSANKVDAVSDNRRSANQSPLDGRSHLLSWS